jgi:hypothetical protein
MTLVIVALRSYSATSTNRGDTLPELLKNTFPLREYVTTPAATVMRIRSPVANGASDL